MNPEVTYNRPQEKIQRKMSKKLHKMLFQDRMLLAVLEAMEMGTPLESSES